MTERLSKIYSELPSCKIFADIGCDHGYISKAMLDGGKCEKVILSDVSAKCLKKAENLLSEYISKGKAVAIVSNGFDNLPNSDLSLIAGMGGEEIILILQKAKTLPEKLVLQPMKNCDKVRRFLIENGYKIVGDFVFKAEEKFYDIIKCEKGQDSLTEEEIEFGRTNLLNRPCAFIERLSVNILALENRANTPDMPKEIVNNCKREIERLNKYVKND